MVCYHLDLHRLRLQRKVTCVHSAVQTALHSERRRLHSVPTNMWASSHLDGTRPLPDVFRSHCGGISHMLPLKGRFSASPAAKSPSPQSPAPSPVGQRTKHTSQGGPFKTLKGILKRKKSKQLARWIFFTKWIRCFSIVEIISHNTRCPKNTTRNYILPTVWFCQVRIYACSHSPEIKAQSCLETQVKSSLLLFGKVSPC